MRLAAPFPSCDEAAEAASHLPAGSGTFMLFQAGFSRRPTAEHYITFNIIFHSFQETLRYATLRYATLHCTTLPLRYATLRYATLLLRHLTVI